MTKLGIIIMGLLALIVAAQLAKPLWKGARNRLRSRPKSSVQAIARTKTRLDVRLLCRSLGSGEPKIRRAAADAIADIIVAGGLANLDRALMTRDMDVRTFAALWALAYSYDSSSTGQIFSELAGMPQMSYANDPSLMMLQMVDHLGVDRLVRDLGDGNSAVRSTAGLACDEIFRIAGVDPFVKVLQSSDANLRKLAAWVLGAFGDPDASPWLGAALQDDDIWVHLEAAAAMWKIRDARGVKPLLTLMDNDVENVAALARKRLAGIGAVKGLEQLEPVLADRYSGVRVQAVAAMALLKDPKAVPLLTPLLTEGGHTLREEAAKALGVIGHTSALEPLAQVLEDKRRDAALEPARLAAAGALGRIGNIKALAPLARAMQQDSLRHAAQDALIELAAKVGSGPLLAALADQDEAVRHGAAFALRHATGQPALEPLLRALADSSAKVRAEAAAALGLSGDPAAVPHLIEALAQTEEAWPALVQMGPIAASPLLEALKRPNANERMRAALALGGIGAAVAAEPLCELLSDNVPGVRAAAAKALGQLGQASVSAKLTPLLGDKEQDVVVAAAEALGNMRSGAAVGALLAMLEDNAPQVRQTAAKALGSIGEAEAVPDLTRLIKDGNLDVRATAVDALGNVGGKVAVEALIDVLLGLSDPVAKRAATALGHLGAPEALGALAEVMYEAALAEPAAKALADIGKSLGPDELNRALKSRDATTRLGAANALRHSPHERCIGTLIALLEDRDPRVRAGAAQALGVAARQEAVAPLAAALGDKDKTVADQVAGALAAIGTASSPTLIGKLRSGDGRSRRRAARVLALLEDRRAEDPLKYAMADAQPEVRVEAALGLGILKSSSSVDLLTEALRDSSKEVRAAAARALGEIGQEKAIRPLVRAKSDSIKAVRDASLEALKKIGKDKVAEVMAQYGQEEFIELD